MQGSLQRPSLSGQIAAENLQVQRSQWKSAKAVLHVDPSQVTIAHASLVNAQQGTLSLSGQVQLQNWSYQPANAIHANISAQGLSLTDLQNLAHVSYPLSGNLSAQISLQGSELHPAGHGSLAIVNASAYQQPIQNFAIQFHTANDSIESILSVTLPAGTASGTLDFTPKTKAYKLDLRTPGLILQKLQAIAAKKLPIEGTLTASATGAGTIENPQLDVVLQLPSLQVRDTSLTSLQAEMKVENQHAYLSLSSSVTQVYVRASATVDLVGDFYAQASIDTSKISLDPLLTVYAPGMPPGFHGETELHASLRGPLKNSSQIEAHLTIPTLTGTYQSLQFDNVGPIRADYANSVIVLAPGEIRGTDTSIHFQGRVPLTEAEGIALQAQGDMNLALLNIFNSNMTSRGALDFDIRGSGNIHHPSMQGTVQVRNAALSISSAPIAISKVNGSLTLNENKIQISSFTGEMGGGKVSLGGSVAFSPSLQFNLAVQGTSMRMLYPAGVRSVLDGNLTFTGNLQAATLRGRVLIDSLNFTPDFDLSTFASQFNTPSIPPLNQTFSDNIQLAVALLSPQNLSARSSQISLSGMTNLQVIGTVANPVIIGRVDLASGELFFMSNRYVLQRGILSFNDPNQTSPVLNVQVTTTIEQYNLTLTFTGPLDRLATSYVSNPALPTADVISLIYRGQTSEEAAAAGTSTDSLLAGPAASQFSSGLQKLTGISSLQIDPLLGGNGTNPTARIAVQQRVTNNFLFTFSTDVSQPESEIILGQYQLSPRWSISVERDQLGGIAVDGHLHTKF
jgi:translocation and assembly module TamB